MGSPMLNAHVDKTTIVIIFSIIIDYKSTLASSTSSASSASSAYSRRIDQGVGSPMPMPMWTKRQLVHLYDHQRWSAEGSRDDQIRQMISSIITGCIIQKISKSSPQGFVRMTRYVRRSQQHIIILLHHTRKYPNPHTEFVRKLR